MEPAIDDTQEIQGPLGAEIEALLARLQPLVSDASDDPRHRLLAALIAVWDDGGGDRRLEAARNLLTLDQRDVWFLTRNVPVEALDEAAAGLLVALGDAITATGANFSFDTDEPTVATSHADAAYVELGDAIRNWKAEVIQAHRRR